MPIYTYECKDCGEKFDFLVGVVASKEELKCKKCGSRSVEKIFVPFSVKVSSGSGSTSSGPSCPTGTCPTCF